MSGVYGNPITNETLEGLPEYDNKTIEAVDRARVALRWINSEGKDEKAFQFLNQDLQSYNSDKVAAICLVNFGDWWKKHGWLGSTPNPETIQNGQWGAFLVRGENGVEQAVVYRGPDAEWCLGFRADTSHTTFVYTEINKLNYFSDNWSSVENALSGTSTHPVHTYEWDGYSSSVSIGMDKPSLTFRAVLSLKDAY